MDTHRFQLPAAYMVDFTRHSPAGERVSSGGLFEALTGTAGRNQDFNGWTAFDSGTAALSAVLAHAVELRGQGGIVALPAYSCPSLVAASHFAGLTVRFLDMADGLVAADEQQTNDALAAGVQSLVVVELFGAGRPPGGIAATTQTRDVLVVLDRAQSLVELGDAEHCQADYVITSFGRGKPASLLGGGAAWARQLSGFSRFTAGRFPVASWHPGISLLKAWTYNLLLRPRLYGTIAWIPMLRLGETRLTPVRTVRRLPDSFLVAAASQIAVQRRSLPDRKLRTVWLVERLMELGFSIPRDAYATALENGLNRLPVLCSGNLQRDTILREGRRYGLSAMYGRTLPEFVGVTAADSARRYPVAFRMSRCMLTVPTHSRLSENDMSGILEAFANAK